MSQPTPSRAATAARRLAALAGRLTHRDRMLCGLLAEHHVLTTHQIAEVCFPSLDAAQHRLAALRRLELVDRFRPRLDLGSAPYHYVLGPAGAAVLAADRGGDPNPTGYRHDKALAIAHSHQLAHLVGVNGFFTALARTARTQPGAALLAWWSERRCRAHWGALIRPDGYGRWRDVTGETDFFLEYDRGTEPLDRLAAKLPGYAELAAASGIATPVLLWLPTTTREAAARRALRPVAPAAPLTATGTPELGRSPADAVWLPLDTDPGADASRQRLARLQQPPSHDRPP